jgi:hypothetical protein
MCDRQTPSRKAPSLAIAACERSLRASVTRATRLTPSTSNAWDNRSSLHSGLTAPPPRRRVIPRRADLDPLVPQVYVEVAGTPDQLPIGQPPDGERNLLARIALRDRLVEPRVEPWSPRHCEGVNPDALVISSPARPTSLPNRSLSTKCQSRKWWTVRRGAFGLAGTVEACNQQDHHEDSEDDRNGEGGAAHALAPSWRHRP